MLCKIADLITQVPTADGLAIRCVEYLHKGNDSADIIIRTELYDKARYETPLSAESLAYMEAAYQFYMQLLNYEGFYLHASAVVRDGKAYLFSGPCGTGKSTHTRLWCDTFPGCTIINDDKPALRCIDGVWYAYGTPWCGKDGINQNMRSPLAGICFLKQAKENRIRQLTATEALRKILSQTIHKFHNIADLDLLLSHLGNMLGKIPVFEMENLPQPEAAILSYETMHKCAGEMSL